MWLSIPDLEFYGLDLGYFICQNAYFIVQSNSCQDHIRISSAFQQCLQSIQISRLHSPVVSTFLAKPIQLRMFWISSCFFSSGNSAKLLSDFSKRNNLISGSILRRKSESSSPFPFRNWMITTLFPSTAACTALPIAAGDLPLPSPV